MNIGNMTAFAFAIISIGSAIVSIASMWLYTRRMEAEMKDIARENIELKNELSDMKLQNKIINDQYTALMRQLVVK